MYCNLIIEQGGDAHCVNEQGLIHGYLRARHDVKRAAKSFDRIIDAIVALANRHWPYPGR
jgi:acetyl esterase